VSFEPAAVAMHWHRQLVYFSTSRDRVHRISFNATRPRRRASRRRARGTETAVTTPASAVLGRRRGRARRTRTVAGAAELVYEAGSRAGAAGLGLSVDWLYDRLYVADQNTVQYYYRPSRPTHP